MNGADPQETTHETGLSFEEAFARLGEVVHGLETGGLTLEQATQLYEEGMRLAQVCNQLLNRTELRVTELKTAYSSVLGDQPAAEDESAHP